MSPAPQGITIDTSSIMGFSPSMPTTLPVTGTSSSTLATTTTQSSLQDGSSFNTQAQTNSTNSSKGVGIALGIAIFVVLVVIISTLLFFVARKSRLAKLQKQSQARLIRRSQIEDAPPPYIRNSTQESMYKGELPPVPQQDVPPRTLPQTQGTATTNLNAASSQGSWTTMPKEPAKSYYLSSPPMLSRFST